MKKELLLTIATGLLYTTAAIAQTCTTPPSCESLGYTETEAYCSSGKMLRCPFDQTKVYCNARFQMGAIYYSDGTFSYNVIPEKTPVGIVFRMGDSGGAVIALEEKPLAWSTGQEDVSCLANNANFTVNDMDGKSNTMCLVNTGNRYKYPAAEYCNSFKAVSSGKGSSGWYLPAAGELYGVMVQNRAINERLQEISKPKISGTYWSSSEGNSGALKVGELPSVAYNRYQNIVTDIKTRSYPVRCALAI